MLLVLMPKTNRDHFWGEQEPGIRLVGASEPACRGRVVEAELASRGDLGRSILPGTLGLGGRGNLHCLLLLRDLPSRDQAAPPPGHTPRTNRGPLRAPELQNSRRSELSESGRL